MAIRGTKPTPTRVKELRGNPGKRPLPTIEVTPTASSARTPNRMGREAGRFWRRYAPALRDLGVLTEIDEPALRLMAEHFALAVQAIEMINATGLLVTDVEGNLRKNPLAQVMRDNSAAFRAYAGEFGMTPSSRTRLQPQDTGQMSLADELFGKIMEMGSQEVEVDPLAEFEVDEP